MEVFQTVFPPSLYTSFGLTGLWKRWQKCQNYGLAIFTVL